MLVWAGGEGGKDSEGSEHRGVGANVSRGAYGPLLHGQVFTVNVSFCVIVK